MRTRVILLVIGVLCCGANMSQAAMTASPLGGQELVQQLATTPPLWTAQSEVWRVEFRPTARVPATVDQLAFSEYWYFDWRWTPIDLIPDPPTDDDADGGKASTDTGP